MQAWTPHRTPHDIAAQSWILRSSSCRSSVRDVVKDHGRKDLPTPCCEWRIVFSPLWTDQLSGASPTTDLALKTCLSVPGNIGAMGQPELLPSHSPFECDWPCYKRKACGRYHFCSRAGVDLKQVPLASMVQCPPAQPLGAPARQDRSR